MKLMGLKVRKFIIILKDFILTKTILIVFILNFLKIDIIKVN